MFVLSHRLGRQDDFELLVQLSQSGIHEIEESSTRALHDLNTFVGKLVAAVKTLVAGEERKEFIAKIKRSLTSFLPDNTISPKKEIPIQSLPLLQLIIFFEGPVFC